MFVFYVMREKKTDSLSCAVEAQKENIFNVLSIDLCVVAFESFIVLLRDQRLSMSGTVKKTKQKKTDSQYTG